MAVIYQASNRQHPYIDILCHYLHSHSNLQYKFPRFITEEPEAQKG